MTQIATPSVKLTSRKPLLGRANARSVSVSRTALGGVDAYPVRIILSPLSAKFGVFFAIGLVIRALTFEQVITILVSPFLAVCFNPLAIVFGVIGDGCLRLFRVLSVVVARICAGFVGVPVVVTNALASITLFAVRAKSVFSFGVFVIFAQRQIAGAFSAEFG